VLRALRHDGADVLVATENRDQVKLHVAHLRIRFSQKTVQAQRNVRNRVPGLDAQRQLAHCVGAHSASRFSFLESASDAFSESKAIRPLP